MPKYHIPKPVKKILHQKGPRCYAYGIAMLMETLFWEKYRINLDLDAFRFYNESREFNRNRFAPLGIACDAAVEVGLRDKRTGRYFKAKRRKRVMHRDVWSEALKGNYMILGVDLEIGEPFSHRLNKDGMVTRRTRGYHTLVSCPSDKKNPHILICANTWPKFGKSGYCFVPKVMQTRYKKFVYEAYKLTV